MLDFNKKIAQKILEDLQNAKKQTLSVTALAKNIEKNLLAVDSTFPKHIKEMLEETLSKISDHQQEQYAALLNTPEAGSYDETLPVGQLFNDEIFHLNEYTLK